MVADLVNALARRGHHVHLFTVGTSTGSRVDAARVDCVPGVPGGTLGRMSAEEAERRESEGPGPDWIPPRAHRIFAHFAVPRRLDSSIDVVDTRQADLVFCDSVDLVH